MTLLFFGTSEFAVPSLRQLAQSPHRILAIVTRPGHPKGRKTQRECPSPLEQLGIDLGLPILKPEDPNHPEFLKQLKMFHAELAVVVSYGAILSQMLLDLFPLGAINLHASLLPKFRGAAPIQWALIHGESETGVTVFALDTALDHGPILLQAAYPIPNEADAVVLSQMLAEEGAKLLLDAIDRLEAGTLNPIPQDDTKASWAPRLCKRDGILDWTQHAVQLFNRIRAVQPWPGAWTALSGRLIKIDRATFDITQDDPTVSPGTIVKADPRVGLWVQTGRGQLRVDRLQPTGKKSMTASEFLCGHPIRPGYDRFHPPPSNVLGRLE
jgi:methionyl-tRNA formyltransferase